MSKKPIQTPQEMVAMPAPKPSLEEIKARALANANAQKTPQQTPQNHPQMASTDPNLVSAGALELFRLHSQEPDIVIVIGGKRYEFIDHILETTDVKVANTILANWDTITQVTE